MWGFALDVDNMTVSLPTVKQLAIEKARAEGWQMPKSVRVASDKMTVSLPTVKQLATEKAYAVVLQMPIDT